MPELPDFWEPLDGPLVPSEHLAEVEAALGLVGEGTPDESYGDRVRAVVPPLAGVRTLVGDAFDLVGGDLVAAERFGRALELLPGIAGGPSEAADEMPLEELATRLGPHSGEAAERVAPQERLVPVLLAAAYLGTLDDGRAAPLGILMAELPGLGPLDTVWEAARQALGGSARDLEHFQDVFEAAERGSLPMPPPLPWPVPAGFGLDVIPGGWLRDTFKCAVEASLIMGGREPGGRVKVPPYHITSIAPTSGCAGTVVTITGTGFGTAAGEVVFPGVASVPAQSWTETTIQVAVPQGAFCGKVGLWAPEEALGVCGRSIRVSWPGVGAEFEGSSARIRRFTVNGRSQRLRVNPGAPIVVRWAVCPAAGASVSLEVRLPTQTYSLPLSAQGTQVLLAHSTYTGQNKLRLTLKAANACEPAGVSESIDVLVQPIADLTVTGMEVTQAIQYYRADQHLTDPADRGPTNSLELVAIKETWVRAYVDSGVPNSWGGGSAPDVSAVLRVSRISDSSITQIGTRLPQKSITAYAGPWTGYMYRIARKSPIYSLNFRVPSYWCDGTVRFDVELNPLGTVQESNYANNFAHETIDFLRYRWIELRAMFFVEASSPYHPNLDDLQKAAWAMERAFPISNITYSDLGKVVVQNISRTLHQNEMGETVLDAQLAAGNPPEAVFVGVFPETADPTIKSAGGGGFALVRAGNAWTLAHEVAHALGLHHAACDPLAPDPTQDPNYPAYEPYDTPTARWSSIGEFGWDVIDGKVFDPDTDVDFMSYCGGNTSWISIYHYRRLLTANRIRSTQVLPAGESLGLTAAGAGAGRVHETGVPLDGDAEVADRLYLRGVIDIAGESRLEGARRVEGHPAASAGERTPYRVVLRDSAGTQLASATVTRTIPPTEDEPLTAFVISLPANERAQRIVLERDGEEVDRIEAPSAPPELEITTLEVDDDHARLRWRTHHPDGTRCSYWVRASVDAGRTWQPLAVGLDDEELETPLTHIPGGGSCVLQVAAHDGFHSVYRQTAPFELSVRPPRAVILAPEDGANLVSGRDIFLRGEGYSPQDGSLPVDALEWASDRDGPLGFGARLIVDALSPGDHRITFTVRDVRAQIATGEVHVSVPVRHDD